MTQFVWLSLCVFQAWIHVCYKWIVYFELSKVISWILCNSKSLHDYTTSVSCKCHVVVFWQGLHFVCFVAIGRSYCLEGIFGLIFSCSNILWFCNDFWCKNSFGNWSQIRPRYLKVMKKKTSKTWKEGPFLCYSAHPFIPFSSFPFFLFIFLSLPLPLCHHHLGRQWWQQRRAWLLPPLPRALNF